MCLTCLVPLRIRVRSCISSASLCLSLQRSQCPCLRRFLIKTEAEETDNINRTIPLDFLIKFLFVRQDSLISEAFVYKHALTEFGIG